MEKKRCNRQIVVAVILLALVLVFLGLLVWKLTSDWRQRGRVENAVMELTPTATHSQADLDAAAEAVREHFACYRGCELERLWYDPVQAAPLEREVCENTERQPEQVIVFLADFQSGAQGCLVRENFEFHIEPNTNYTDYRFLLLWHPDLGWQVQNSMIEQNPPESTPTAVTPPPTPTS